MKGENIKHIEAFNDYFLLGADRSYKPIAEKYKVSEQAICQWSKKFGWNEEILRRDKEVGKILEKKSIKEIARINNISINLNQVTIFLF